jgi:nucleotide-binding universal stress UspA family protein
MYSNILIPTDGSELAGKAVQHGIALAQRIRGFAAVPYIHHRHANDRGHAGPLRDTYAEPR